MKRLLVTVSIAIGATAAVFVALASGGPTTVTVAGACTNSYPIFANLAGHWEGNLQIPSLSIDNELTVDAIINSDCTAGAVIMEENVGTWTVSGTFFDSNGGATLMIVNDAVFADTTIEVTAAGVITIVEGSMPPYGIKDVDGTGTVTATSLSLGMILTYNDDSTADQTIHLSREITPTPTAEPTASPTPVPSETATAAPTPTATPAGASEVWGDSDCNGSIGARDNQALLRNVLAQAPLSQEEGCPAIGETVVVTNV